MVDLTRDNHGKTRARLLDLVPGRSGKAYATWLAERGDAFRRGVKVAALDPFRGYKNAVDDQLAEQFRVVAGDGRWSRWRGTALAQVGAMPLPPYIAALRAPDDQDRTDYQTVWARHSGAVAAPTASLHFDDDLLAALRGMGVEFAHVTLHVGAGTFLPVKTDDVSQHRMHAERGIVTPDAAAAITTARAEGRRVIAVGTTALRLIESAAGPDGTVRPFDGETDIFIRPGHAFRVTDGLMTNFHLPKSTLFMLVSACARSVASRWEKCTT